MALCLALLVAAQGAQAQDRAMSACALTLDDRPLELNRLQKTCGDYARSGQNPADLRAQAFAFLSFGLYYMGLPEEALAAAQEATRVEAFHPLGHQAAALALNGLYRPAEALSAANESLELLPASDFGYYLRAKALFGLDRYEGALAAVRDAVKVQDAIGKRPQGAYYAVAALALGALGRTDEALEQARRGAELDPDDPDVLLALADVHYRVGDLAVAFETALRALERSSVPNRHVHLIVGFAGQRLGAFDRALASGEALMDEAPHLAAGYFIAALALAGLGRTDEALAPAREAVRIAPDSLTAQRTLALAAGLDAAWAEAFAAGLRARDLAGDDDPSGLATLALVQALAGSTEAAGASADALLEYEPLYPEEWAIVGLVRNLEGNFLASRAAFDAAEKGDAEIFGPRSPAWYTIFREARRASGESRRHALAAPQAVSPAAASGAEAPASGEAAGAAPYVLVFDGFSADEMIAVEDFLVVFAGYRAFRLMDSAGGRHRYAYDSGASAAALSRDLERMLAYLAVEGEVRFADGAFRIGKLPAQTDARRE